MQEISIVTSRSATVDHPPGSRYAYLTFEGLRESRTIADKHTRLRVSMPLAEMLRLRELLDLLTDDVQQ